MATITDRTYYQIGRLLIPNVKDKAVAPVTTPTTDTTLDLYIRTFERDLLLNALGVNLYNIFKALLKATPGTPLVGKWKDLVEGTDYEINGTTYQWDGLRGYEKQSLVAFFIKSQYLKQDETTFTSAGMSMNMSKNAIAASYRDVFVGIWSEFIKQYQGDVRTKKEVIARYNMQDVYRDPIFSGYRTEGVLYQTERNVQSSLFQYLCDANELDSTAFPNFNFKLYKRSNRYGI
jgi:hypothetical protein